MIRTQGTQRSTATRLAGPLAAATLAGVGLLVAPLMAQSDSGPVTCPFRAVTGLDCPFCGATRATAALATGDLGAALDHNLLYTALIVPLLAVGWLLWTRSAASGRSFPVIPNWAIKAFLWLVLAWWALRLAVPWLGSGLG